MPTDMAAEHASSLRGDWLSADGVARNRKFESSSLQRGVHANLVSAPRAPGAAPAGNMFFKRLGGEMAVPAGRVSRRWRWPASASTYARVLPPNRPGSLEGKRTRIDGRPLRERRLVGGRRWSEPSVPRKTGYSSRLLLVPSSAATVRQSSVNRLRVSPFRETKRQRACSG